MKKRFGFVSNSSSSSFIIGFGTVKNEQLLKEYMNHHGLEFGYEFHMFACNGDYYDDADGEVCGGNDTSITIPENMRNESTVVVSVQNDEGDSDFAVYENGEFVELDYSCVDYDYFDEDQQALIDLFKQPFIENGRVRYGAERNG